MATPNSLVILTCCCILGAASQAYTTEVIESLEANLRDALVDLGETASHPNPQLGIEKGFDPLAAIAPLRYTNEGELLKLRLLLNNVTLSGLSTLTVQEVSFKTPGNLGVYYKSDNITTTPATSNGEDGTAHHGKMANHEHNKKEYKSELTEEEDNPLEDMYDYYYYDSSLHNPTIHENTESEEYEYDEGDLYTEDLDKDNGNYYYESQSAHRYKRSGHNARVDHSHHTKGRHSRRSKSKRHDERSPRDQHDQMVHGSQDQILNYETLFSHLEHPARHNHHPDHQKKSIRGSEATQLSPTHPERSLPPKPLGLKANVRVSFSNLRISAQYVVKGSAGGVFTFKEQGHLILSLPNVFLTSTFNVTVAPDISGLRHWKNGRNLVRVQKIRTQMTIKDPALKLIPDSRPPEWVRRQVQQKMEELGGGVGRRDGAVRLLLRHWARILRKLVTKAAKSSKKGH